jgi:hypothetical protein
VFYWYCGLFLVLWFSPGTLQEKIREPGNTTISGENQKTWKKLDYQGNSQYQVKTTAPEKKPREVI